MKDSDEVEGPRTGFSIRELRLELGKDPRGEDMGELSILSVLLCVKRVAKRLLASFTPRAFTINRLFSILSDMMT